MIAKVTAGVFLTCFSPIPFFFTSPVILTDLTAEFFVGLFFRAHNESFLEVKQVHYIMIRPLFQENDIFRGRTLLYMNIIHLTKRKEHV